MKLRITGIAIQLLIWLLLFYLIINEQNHLEFPNYLVLIVLIIAIFIYFNELLLKSSIYTILSRKPKSVKNKLEIIKYLTASKLFLEINTKAFHYTDNKESITYNRFDYFEFDYIKDQSSVKTMPLYFDENYLSDDHNKFIVININLSTLFSDASCFEELEASITKLKNDASFKDKYYDTKTRYILRGLKEEFNVFCFNNEYSMLLNKVLFIASYILFVGEFYKILIENYLTIFDINLVKQIGRRHANESLGNLLENNPYQYHIESYDEDICQLHRNDSVVENGIRKVSNNSYRKVSNASQSKNSTVIKAINDKNKEFYYIQNEEAPPKIENYDEVFEETSMTPLIHSTSRIIKNNAYLDFRDSCDNICNNDLEDNHKNAETNNNNNYNNNDYYNDDNNYDSEEIKLKVNSSKNNNNENTNQKTKESSKDKVRVVTLSKSSKSNQSTLSFGPGAKKVIDSKEKEEKDLSRKDSNSGNSKDKNARNNNNDGFSNFKNESNEHSNKQISLNKFESFKNTDSSGKGNIFNNNSKIARELSHNTTNIEEVNEEIKKPTLHSPKFSSVINTDDEEKTNSNRKEKSDMNNEISETSDKIKEEVKESSNLKGNVTYYKDISNKNNNNKIDMNKEDKEDENNEEDDDDYSNTHDINVMDMFESSELTKISKKSKKTLNRNKTNSINSKIKK